MTKTNNENKSPGTAANLFNWQVYIILSSDNCYYTGITTDIDRRLQEHKTSPKGAKYFRGRKPVRVVYLEQGHDRSTASRRESAIKRMTRAQKEHLVKSFAAAD